MKQVTTLFLKLAVIFIGIPVLALCIFLVLHMVNFVTKLYRNIAAMKYLVFILMYGATVPFYLALYGGAPKKCGFTTVRICRILCSNNSYVARSQIHFNRCWDWLCNVSKLSFVHVILFYFVYFINTCSLKL